MLSLLAECTELILNVLCQMYWEQRITRTEFKSLSETKMMFLTDVINQLDSEAEIESAKDIINKCASILSENAETRVAINYTAFNLLQ